MILFLPTDLKGTPVLDERSPSDVVRDVFTPSTSFVGKFIVYSFVNSVWIIHLGMSPSRITFKKKKLKAMPLPALYCFEESFLNEMLYSSLVYSIVYIATLAFYIPLYILLKKN